jgi:hypothetical protein
MFRFSCPLCQDQHFVRGERPPAEFVCPETSAPVRLSGLPGSARLTQRDWEESRDTRLLLFLVGPGVSPRRKHLYLAALSRRLLYGDDSEGDEIAAIVERWADEPARPGEPERVRAFVERWQDEQGGWLDLGLVDAARALAGVFEPGLRTPLLLRESSEGKLHATIREVFPGPFRAVIVLEGWLRANGGAVPQVARVIYEERRFADLPILADALEEAGCSDAHLLAHLRSPGPHLRGCWALDALLGRL